MRTLLLTVVLLLAGCAQPSPLFPQPPGPDPMAAGMSAPAPRPKAAAAGDVRVVGEAAKPACETCRWSIPEILSALAASGLLAWALAKLYRAKAGKDGR